MTTSPAILMLNLMIMPIIKMLMIFATAPHKSVAQKPVPDQVSSPAIPPPPSAGYPVVYNIPYGKRSHMGGEAKSASNSHRTPA